MVRDIGFIRRKNPDSTTDSICLRCFTTVGSGKDEKDLSMLEMMHCCDPLQVRFPLNYEDRMSLPEKVEWFPHAREESPQKGSR
jgi:hypothetical protein